MKKMLGILCGFLWLVFGVTFVIRWCAGDGGLLAAEMLRTAPPERTGLAEKEYAGVGTVTAEYLSGKREKFQYVVSSENADGTACMRSEVFQEHEAAHMADCRELIRLDKWVCAGCLALCAACGAAGLFSRRDREKRERREGRKVFLRGMLRGAAGFLGIAGAIGIWALADFSSLFLTFHRVAFTNDGWLLDPRTDLLIRLMPTEFFIRLGIRGLLRFGGFLALTGTGIWIGLRKMRESSDPEEGT